MNNFWTGTVLALLLGGLGLSAQAAEQGPQQMVMDTTKEVLKILDRERDKIKKDPNHIYGLIDKHVLPHFDFERMSRWTLGRHWRTASEKQKERFIAQFRTLLVRTYASSLLEFSGQKIEFLPFRKGSDEKEAMVRSEVEQAGPFPIPINYRL
ncbi:MAG: ABC transporter substrate-binding protein, partial [Gammaproteobacteria bacterium]|nr:ABC transporter substrate-binding protein [Gammaproteobacteria bacterium]